MKGLSYTMNENVVAYDESPSRVKKLLQTRAVGNRPKTYINGDEETAVFHPQILHDIQNASWGGFGTYGNRDGLAFLHERRSGYNSRLIAVLPGFYYQTNQTNGVFGVKWHTWKPGWKCEKFKILEGVMLLPHAGHLQMFFGQPDSADAAHFTIKYDIDNIPGTIDGWLQNDDTVKLQIRDGPAMQSSLP